MEENINIQKVIFDNNVNKGFNTTNIELEFCYTHGELAINTRICENKQ